jgi:hypothetical protein
VTLPPLLRAASAVLVVGLAMDIASSETGGTTVLEAGPDAVSALSDALVAPTPPDRIVWEQPAGPSASTALLLAPGPTTPALTLSVGPLPRLRATGPERPMVGRAAVLDVDVRGPALDSVVVRWSGAVGDGDSTLVALDDLGRARVGLGVRPNRAGWQAWTLSAGADTIAAGAWAQPARPLRVRALVGAPGSESRYVLRALEEAGVDVDAAVELGRVGIEPPQIEPETRDVVLLLGDPELDAATRARLAAFVASGGGIVVAPGVEGAEPDSATRTLLAAWGVGDGAAPGATLAAGDSVTWSLPAALSPLPPAPAPVRIALRAPAASGRAVGRIDGRPVAILSTPGVGRVGWTGIAESWRWRMEGGAVEAHRAWWRGLVEWAASGVREPIVARLPTAVVPGTVVTVRLEAIRPEEALWPDAVQLTAPDGRVERLPVVPMRPERAGPDPGAPRHARFLADVPGEYRVSWDEDAEAGLRVDAELPPPDPGDVGLLALASGSTQRPGRPLAPGGEPPADDLRDARPWSPDGHRPPPISMGYALAALLLAEWALRRRAGGP